MMVAQSKKNTEKTLASKEWQRASRVALFLVAITQLSGCSSRPYSCQYFQYPPTFKYLEGGWTHSALVCETRVGRDLFTYQKGVLLSISVEDANGLIVAQREVFFINSEDIEVTSHWSDAVSLSVQLSEELTDREGEGKLMQIGEILLTLPAP